MAGCKGVTGRTGGGWGETILGACVLWIGNTDSFIWSELYEGLTCRGGDWLYWEVLGLTFDGGWGGIFTLILGWIFELELKPEEGTFEGIFEGIFDDCAFDGMVDWILGGILEGRLIFWWWTTEGGMFPELYTGTLLVL